MKNVVINKLRRFVFTEPQLKSYWKSLGEDLEFESLTNEQLMKLGHRMFENSSHSALEQHILGHGWRTEADITGKMVADDDSFDHMHIEVIDTSLDGSATKILIDRVLELKCNKCGFGFYVDNVNLELEKIKCPSCSGEVSGVKQKRIIKRV